MDPKEPFDPVRHVDTIFAILSAVSVSGANNIANMNAAFSRLQYMREKFQEQKTEKDEAPRDEI